MRLANPNPHASKSQLYAEMGLIDGLLTPPGGLGAFVRRQLLLPRDVLDELDRRAPKRRPRSTIGRGVGVLGRYGLTMTRLVRPPKRCSEAHRAHLRIGLERHAANQVAFRKRVTVLGRRP